MKPSNPWPTEGEVGAIGAIAAPQHRAGRASIEPQARLDQRRPSTIAGELAEATVDEFTQAVCAAIAAGWTVIAAIIWLVVIGYALKLAVIG